MALSGGGGASTFGVAPCLRQQRLALAERIAARLRAQYAESLIAVGIYGSTARNDDGPYSDLEMMAVLSEGKTRRYEWATGTCKAEVNVLSRAQARADASALDVDWAMTHGQFIHVLPLFDSQGVFAELRACVYQHSRAAFDELLREIIIGEMLELVGKWRNMAARAEFSLLAVTAVQFARQACWLAGAAHQHVFSASARMFAEALALPDLPAGFDTLCARVLRGDLSDPQSVLTDCESLWQGVVLWAERRHLQLVTDPLELGS
ncbi:MAG: hypothetical protein NZ693_11100 [Thermoflexales bacterium]|nr:hypothetical protein [Thermoflexales bacterium]